MKDIIQIEIHCVWHTDYEWTCSYGHENLEPEGQLDLDDIDFVYCSSCNKEYKFDRKTLKLTEEIEE